MKRRVFAAANSRETLRGDRGLQKRRVSHQQVEMKKKMKKTTLKEKEMFEFYSSDEQKHDSKSNVFLNV